MSTTRDVKFANSSVSITSAMRAEVLEKIDALEKPKQEEGTPDLSVRSKSARRQFLAETANPLAPVPAKLDRKDPPKPKSSGDLFEYLTELMLFQLSTGKNQTTIATMNQQLTDESLQVLKGVAAKAQADLVTYNEQEEARSKASFWSIFCSIAAMVVGVGLCAVGGGAFLIAMGAASLGMSMIHTPDGQSLNEALETSVASLATQITGGEGNSPAWLVAAVKDILLFVIVALATAVGTGGANAIDDALASTATVDTAPEDIEMTSLAADAEQEATVTVQKETVTTVQNTAKAAAKRLEKLRFNGFMGNLVMFASSSQFSQDVCQQIAAPIARAMYPDPQDAASEQEAEAIISGILQITGGLAGGYAGAKMNDTVNTTKLRAMMTEEKAKQITLRLKALQTLLNGGSAVFDIRAGNFMLDQEASLKDQAQSRFEMAIVQGMIDSLQTIFGSMQSTFKGVYKDLANMNDVGDRLSPYNPQNYI